MLSQNNDLKGGILIMQPGNFTLGANANLKESPPRLYVYGSVLVYHNDDRISVTEAVPQGLNPTILILNLTISEGSSPMKGIFRDFSYEIKDDRVKQYTQVSLQFEDGTVQTVPVNKVETEVYFYPKKLTPKDILTDGPNGTTIKIPGEATLIWVDLSPDAKFMHPTEYILISTQGSTVLRGNWWPVLNGQKLFNNTIIKEEKTPIPIQLFIIRVGN